MIHTLGWSTRHFLTGSLPGHTPLQAVLASGRSRRYIRSRPGPAPRPRPCRGHMHALVPLKVAKRTAGKRAALTFVGFFPSVNAQVSLQVHQLCGGVSAQGAVIGLLPVVCLHVALHVVGVTRGEAAEVARVQFGQFVLSCQCFVTHPVSHPFTVKLHMGARANPTDASKRWTEVRAFGFPGSFAAPKAVWAN